MLYQLLLSCLLYLSVYASPSQLPPRADSPAKFPSVEKALVGVFNLKPGITVGTIATGATLIDSLVSGGSLKTVQGFQPPLTSVVEHGEDFINIDNDGKRMRLNGKILANTTNGDLLSFQYTGIVVLTPAVQAVLQGSESASTIPFGSIAISGGFETGSTKYKDLENTIFAGTGRLVVHEDKSVSVEYGLSRIVA